MSQARLLMLDVGTEEEPSFVPFVATEARIVHVKRRALVVFAGLALLAAGPKREDCVQLGTGPGRARELAADELLPLELEAPALAPEPQTVAPAPADQPDTPAPAKSAPKRARKKEPTT